MEIEIYGILFEENKVLFVKNDTHWILPGGKPDMHDNSLSCLEREFKEELSGTKIERIKYYKFFEGVTPNSKKDLGAHVYLCKLKGELGDPSGEILDRKYLGKDNISNYDVAPLDLNIFNSLVADKYIE